jgi:hypothetical protein
MTNRRHTGLLMLVLVAGIGCGSQGSPTVPSSFVQEPGPITQPGSATRTSNTVPASNAGVPGVYRFDAAMSRSGTATVTLTWPNGDFSLQLYVTGGDCANATSLVTGACTILGTTRPGTRPGVVTRPVVHDEAVTVWVLNPDEEGPQTFTVDVEIK